LTTGSRLRRRKKNECQFEERGEREREIEIEIEREKEKERESETDGERERKRSILRRISLCPFSFSYSLTERYCSSSPHCLSVDISHIDRRTVCAL
jgi:hypothetical protein